MENHPILDHPEPPKPTGKWLSIKLFGYGLAILLPVVMLSKGLTWLSMTNNWYDGKWSMMLKLLVFLASLGFVVFNIMGLVAAVTYLKAGYDQSERTAGWIGLVLNLLPALLLLAWLWLVYV